MWFDNNDALVHVQSVRIDTEDKQLIWMLCTVDLRTGALTECDGKTVRDQYWEPSAAEPALQRAEDIAREANGRGAAQPEIQLEHGHHHHYIVSRDHRQMMMRCDKGANSWALVDVESESVHYLMTPAEIARGMPYPGVGSAHNTSSPRTRARRIRDESDGPRAATWLFSCVTPNDPGRASLPAISDYP